MFVQIGIYFTEIVLCSRQKNICSLKISHLFNVLNKCLNIFLNFTQMVLYDIHPFQRWILLYVKKMFVLFSVFIVANHKTLKTIIVKQI